jgi:carbon monoxide dehydrogenase subunit G
MGATLDKALDDENWKATLTPQNGGTKVDIVTDLQLTGPVAQYGRGPGTGRVVAAGRQFVDCLKKAASREA